MIPLHLLPLKSKIGGLVRCAKDGPVRYAKDKENMCLTIDHL